jgi:hypothetical protein
MENVIPMQNPDVQRIKATLKNAADAKPVMDIRQLVRGWLTEGGLSVLYGPSNSGKTFVGLSVAAHVAAGEDWFGQPVQQGRVLYAALEGGKSFENRIAAIRQHLPALCQTRGLTYASASLDLFSNEGMTAFCDALPSEDFALIVVDTLARAMAGADENAARDMGQFVGSLDRLREVTGAHVLVVHHSGKNSDAGARGSSALRAAVDTELALSAEGELRATKQRDMAAAPALYIDLHEVSFGENKDGELVTSAVAVATDAPKVTAKPLAGQAEVAMQALSDVLRTKGQKKVTEHFPIGRDVVHIDHWRDMCDRMGLADEGATRDAQSRAFRRAKTKLMEANHIRMFDDHWNSPLKVVHQLG